MDFKFTIATAFLFSETQAFEFSINLQLDILIDWPCRNFTAPSISISISVTPFSPISNGSIRWSRFEFLPFAVNRSY